jgi:hypothetical protein
MAHRKTLAVLVMMVGSVLGVGAEDPVWVPVVAHGPGVGDSEWRSDVTIVNPCLETAEVELVLHLSSGTVRETFEIGPGAQQYFEDVVAQLTADDGSAPLEILASSPVGVASRTYSISESGTFGQAMPAVTAPDLLSAGDVAIVQSLREDGTFRTNLGFLNAGAAAATLSIELFDRLGTPVGSYAVNIGAGRWRQDDRPFLNRYGRDDILAGWAKVTVSSGDGVWISASMIDGRTDDPTTIEASVTRACPLDIGQRLALIPGLTVQERHTLRPGYRYFVLHYTQPADHDDAGSATFGQYMTLMHRDESAPMVLRTLGYAHGTGDRLHELSEMLDANQLVVEHRYFADSRTPSIDWTTLSIEQAATDHHRIASELKPIYAATWINTGHSKGGMTASYHRRFHPEDVDVTVAYVAPMSFGPHDPRYITFLDEVGEASCRDRLTALQRAALEQREDIRPIMESELAGYTFDRIGGDMDVLLEAVVLELPFTFWQYYGESFCAGLVDPETATARQLFDTLDGFVGFFLLADVVFDFYGPYFYQAHYQLGYPGIRSDHLADLLTGDAGNVEAGQLPSDASPPVFDAEAMPDVERWIRSSGERLLFIYGENDPWTAGAYDLTGASDAHTFVDEGGTHGARIGTLAPEDQQAVMDLLAQWTGVTPSPPSKRATADPETDHRALRDLVESLARR